MRRQVMSVLTVAATVMALATPASADQPPRPPMPWGASAEALWQNAAGLEQYLSVAASIGNDGSAEVVAGLYTTRAVRCPDGSADSVTSGWSGGWDGRATADLVVDKQLRSASVSATVDLIAASRWACGRELPPPRARLATHVALDIVATSQAIHSLRVSRVQQSGKPETIRQPSTLRLAAGSVTVGRRTRATTSATLQHDGTGLRGGSIGPAPVAKTLMSPGRRAPVHEVTRASGRFAAGEVRPSDLPESATSGTVLVDESAVNANISPGMPTQVYAGRHRVKVVDCDGELATVEQIWEAMGDGRASIPRSLRTADATASLDVWVERINSCKGTDVTRTLTGVPVALHVTATGRPTFLRSLEWDHEASWTSTRMQGGSRWRDGFGWYSIGAFRTAFSVGGIQAYTHRSTIRIVRW